MAKDKKWVHKIQVSPERYNDVLNMLEYVGDDIDASGETIYDDLRRRVRKYFDGLSTYSYVKKDDFEMPSRRIKRVHCSVTNKELEEILLLSEMIDKSRDAGYTHDYADKLIDKYFDFVNRGKANE